MTPTRFEAVEPTERPGRKAGMPFILLVVLIDMLSVGIIVPVLPSLVGRFTTNAAAQTRWYGAIVFAFAVASFFASPILGALSDRFGRRPLLLLGFCGIAINFFMTAAATALWMLIASRIVGGAMQANAAVANAYVADITPPEERAKRFGLLGAMFGIGFIAGPVVGGILGAIDLRLPFAFAGCLSLVNLAYGFFVLPESLPVDRRRPFAIARANPFSALRRLAAFGGSWRLVAVFACSGLAQFTTFTTWVLYTGFRFHWGPADAGWSLFAIGLVSAITQGALLGPLLKRFSPMSLAIAGLVSSALSYVAFGLATEGWMIYATIVAGFLGGTVAAVMQSVVSASVDGTQQGQAMGSLTALSSLAAVVAPIVATSLLATVSHLSSDDWRLGTPMFFGAIVQTVALYFAAAHFRRHPIVHPLVTHA